MNKLDLRAGNLVYDSDKDVPREIAEIREDFVLFKDRNGCYIDSLSGVEISEEYLSRNGYKLAFDDKEGTRFYENENLSLSLRKGHITVYLKSMRIMKAKDYYLGNISFIHQLQNLENVLRF